MKIYYRKLVSDIIKFLAALLAFVTGVLLTPLGLLYALAHPFLYRYTDLDVGNEPFMPIFLALFIPAAVIAAKLEEHGLLDVGEE